MRAQIDMRKFERDLQRYGKRFGDTTAQAVTRWGVQVARELAKDTFARGKKKGTRGAEEKGVSAQKEQHQAMVADAYRVMIVVDSARRTGRAYSVSNQGKTYSVQANRLLTSESQVMSWVDQNRIRRRKRTAKLQIEQRKVCTRAVFGKYLAMKKKLAGVAKGAWINAGQDLAKAQKGARKIAISQSFLGYAQKASKGAGNATPARDGFSPSAILKNTVAYSSDPEILPRADMQNAIQWALRKTITWYRMAMKPRKNS